jgi:hypothetical protein
MSLVQRLCHKCGSTRSGIRFALPALVLAQKFVTIGAVMLCDVQGPTAEGDKAERPAPTKIKTKNIFFNVIQHQCK